METELIFTSSVDEAREKILYYIQRYKEKRVFCFGGWRGFGVASVLRSIALAIPSMKDPPSELRFGKTIYVDCSRWESKRVMQRKIAEELKLDDKTMAMFDKQDEEDDFHGVDLGSRDVIRSVAAEIDQTLRKTRHMMIFLNGSDEEVPLSRCGIPEYHDCVVIWAFNKSFLNKLCDFEMISKKLSHREIPSYTDVLVWGTWDGTFTRSQFTALLQEEAACVVARYPSCIQDGIDGTTLVTDCCLYGLFLNRSFQATTSRFCWAPHASNYWICDGIIRGDRAREIAIALHTEISLESDSDLLLYYGFLESKLHPESPFLAIVYDDEFDGRYYVKKPYRWVSVIPSGLHLRLGWPPKSEITWTNKEAPEEEMQTIVAGATTVFVAWERTDNNRPHGLPNGLFERCRSLAVLILHYCAFSFVSPPFLHCHTLRFLGLDQCTDDNTAAQFAAGEDCTCEWTFLHSLWVLDLRYTDWGEILSKEKMNLMVNLTELNTEGARCWQYTSSQLHERLPYLQRLRITKPMRQEETSTDMSTSSFIDGRSKLQVLDLSGNSNIQKLPTSSLSKSSSLEALVLDGCDGLHDVLLPNLLLLRTFSFDGYGPASNWTSAATELPPEVSRPKSPPDEAHRKDDEVKTSTISLEGCKLLENLFIRGLPNLVELDLSGCAIKILDLTRMVVDVPKLKRLFLLGCEHLRALRFGSDLIQQLELLCIDTTRPRTGRVLGCPSLAQRNKSFRLQVYAVTADARLTWSLFPLVYGREGNPSFSSQREDNNVYFDINISSSTSAHGGGDVQVDEATASSKEMTAEEPRRDEKKLHQNQMYDDVSVEVAKARNPMQAFPQPPAQKLDHHMEIGYGSRIVESTDIDFPYRNNLGKLMGSYVQSLHVHDVSDMASLPAISWSSLGWCRVERCPSFDVVFPPGSGQNKLEMIWASDLLMARCIWSKGTFLFLMKYSLLRHLHLRSCPSLQFALPLWTRHFNNLETLHIIHCGNLRYAFEHDEKLAYDEDIAHHGAEFPKLTTIYLHDVPNLRQICDVKMLVPALETIQVRGCWGLRRLPHLGDKDGRRRPAVMMEKDVWDALEWDGVDAGHHPSLFQAPVHSQYYKRRMLRGTVLR